MVASGDTQTYDVNPFVLIVLISVWKATITFTKASLSWLLTVVPKCIKHNTQLLVV